VLNDFNGRVFQRIGCDTNPFCDFLELHQNSLVHQDTPAIFMIEELGHRLYAQFDNPSIKFEVQ